MGLKCLIISANLCTIPYPVYPLGTAHIAGALKTGGHDAYVYDLLAQGMDGFKAAVENYSPDIIALSLRNVDTEDSSLELNFLSGLNELCEEIRRVAGVRMIVGGPAFSLFPDELMELTKADFGIVGEGERLIVELADAIEKGVDIPERIFRSDCAGTSWLPVEYSSEIAPFYLQRGGMLNVQTKRGCPFSCAYCSYPLIEGTVIRNREPDEVAEELCRLNSEFGARYVFFTDAVFNDPYEYYLEVAQALVRKKNGVRWCAYFRPDGLDREKLQLLKAAGLAAMEVGTDASSDATLSGLGKSFDFSAVIRFHELTVELQIPCAHFVIFGGPGETRKTLKQGCLNLRYLKGAVVFGFCGIRVIPDTRIHRIAVSEGVISEHQSLLRQVFYFSKDISKKYIEDTIKQEWSGQMDRVFPSHIMHDRIKVLHRYGHIGPAWNMLTSVG